MGSRPRLELLPKAAKQCSSMVHRSSFEDKTQHRVCQLDEVNSNVEQFLPAKELCSHAAGPTESNSFFRDLAN